MSEDNVICPICEDKVTWDRGSYFSYITKCKCGMETCSNLERSRIKCDLKEWHVEKMIEKNKKNKLRIEKSVFVDIFLDEKSAKEYQKIVDDNEYEKVIMAIYGNGYTIYEASAIVDHFTEEADDED